MLRRLALEEFVIIERAALELAPGLNALTGETGAGKSILVDAIGLLCGDRASADWVRRGADRLVVEGEIDLGAAPAARAAAGEIEIPLEEDRLLLLRREVGADGRSRCFAGGRQVLVSQLRALTRGAVWIVGQGEQRALSEPAEQEWILDRLAGATALRAQYRTARARFLEAAERLSALRAEEAGFARDREWLEAQLAEIREARIAPGERARLRELLDRLRGRAAEAALHDELEGRLFREEGSVLDHLETLIHRVRALEGDPWPEVLQRLTALRELTRELRAGLAAGDAELEADPEAVDGRLRLIERLCRRHAEPGAEDAEEVVLARRAELEERLDRGDRLGAAAESAAAEVEARRRETGEHGARLAGERERAADRFAQRIPGELASLGMSGASLRFVLEREADPEGVPAGPGETAPRVRALESGLERVQLRFRPHPAEPDGEMGRVASGGELSRILLAVHAALGAASPPGCWVLDEVDAGVGGETANCVAAMLAAMAARAQVLLVTHLPAIAARAHRQIRVVKSEASGRAHVELRAVEGDERVAELARMLSGEPDSETARRHARELLRAGRGGERPSAARMPARPER